MAYYSVKKYIKIIPIGLAIVLILTLTLMNTQKNMEMSEKFRQFLIRLYDRAGLDTDIWWNTSYGIRKLGHVIEYGLLGMGSAIVTEKKRVMVAICIIVSIFDQCVKALVPIRHFDVSDLLFDLIGSLVGILIVIGIRKWIRINT